MPARDRHDTKSCLNNSNDDTSPSFPLVTARRYGPNAVENTQTTGTRPSPLARCLRLETDSKASQALRGALSGLRPGATYSSANLTARISRSLQQARLLSQEVRNAIDKAVASAPVVLFMKGTPETPQCGFSRTSIQILGLQGVDPAKFTAFNVLEDEDLRSGIKEYSDWPTIPQLYIDKEFIGGCDILINMHKDGSLAKLLAEKQLIVEEEPPQSD